MDLDKSLWRNGLLSSCESWGAMLPRLSLWECRRQFMRGSPSPSLPSSRPLPPGRGHQAPAG